VKHTGRERDTFTRRGRTPSPSPKLGKEFSLSFCLCVQALSKSLAQELMIDVVYCNLLLVLLSASGIAWARASGPPVLKECK